MYSIGSSKTIGNLPESLELRPVKSQNSTGPSVTSGQFSRFIDPYRSLLYIYMYMYIPHNLVTVSWACVSKLIVPVSVTHLNRHLYLSVMW